MKGCLQTIALIAGAVCLTFAQQPAGKKPVKVPGFGGAPRVVWSDSSASEIARHLERTAWAPAVNPEKPRGGVEVYAKVAPAVVVVRTESGHGSGFIINSSGLMLTNHHVVSNSLTHDAARSASYALVYLGRLDKDGGMVLRKDPIKAYLLKLNAAKDLALLKLDSVPKDVMPLPALSFAAAAPRPGSPATIIGHPAAGMLWTMRSGQVASVGRMPTDIVDLLMRRLRAQSPPQDLEATGESQRIILTSANANPGDSGGPVVDATGQVIAVTFAGPGDPSLAKFTYHIHLDEVKQFAASVPAAPIFDIPDAWQLGPNVTLRDLDGDNRPDVLLAGTDEPEQILFDLDNDSAAPTTKDLSGLVRGKKWDFEVALRLAEDEPTSTAFYDTNNDGTVDLVHTIADRDPKINTRFSQTAGQWRVEQNVAITFGSPTYLRDAKLVQRYSALLKRIQAGQ